VSEKMSFWVICLASLREKRESVFFGFELDLYGALVE